MSDVQTKLQLVRNLMSAHALDGILLNKVANFAWLSGGARNYVNSATADGAASLLVTGDRQFVLADNIEAIRLQAEEPLAGFEFVVSPWHDPGAASAGILSKMRLGADGPGAGTKDVGNELASMRLVMSPTEQGRFRQLGRICGDAMDAAIRQVRPRMTEHQLAGLLAKGTLDRGALPIVNLIATDERIYRFRHPLPTDKVLDKYAMLVLCGRRDGLVASITRLIHFGPMPEELQRKQRACAEVDATFIGLTRPGAKVSDVFAAALGAYAATGNPDEWQLHHQGGPAGYEPREWVAGPRSEHVVRENEVYAWNPSITGIKSEDTILVGTGGNEVLTAISGWPMLRVEASGRTFERPAVLEAS